MNGVSYDKPSPLSALVPIKPSGNKHDSLILLGLIAPCYVLSILILTRIWLLSFSNLLLFYRIPYDQLTHLCFALMEPLEFYFFVTAVWPGVHHEWRMCPCTVTNPSLHRCEITLYDLKPAPHKLTFTMDPLMHIWYLLSKLQLACRSNA